MEESAQARYEERVHSDLEEIREKVTKVAELIESQLSDTVHSFLEGDIKLANDVVLGDRRVNRKIREIDRMCHSFIVRHAPTAGPLRLSLIHI